MSIETLRKAERLADQRSYVAKAKWDGVCKQGLRGFAPTEIDSVDEQLQWAIEEYRKRRLDAIDAQLRELGIDPTAES